MKKYLLASIILLSSSVLYAQNYKLHEVKLSVGDAILYDAILNGTDRFYCNVSVAYLYYPVKWLGVGVNFINYFGNSTHYRWREYDINGNFDDFSKSKMKYCAVIAPEIRFSYLNNERAVLYSAISGGIGWENGYDNYDGEHSTEEKYPKTIPHFQITCFGFGVNLGENDNIFLGGEFGLGFKGFFNFHGGYRF